MLDMMMVEENEGLRRTYINSDHEEPERLHCSKRYIKLAAQAPMSFISIAPRFDNLDASFHNRRHEDIGTVSFIAIE